MNLKEYILNEIKELTLLNSIKEAQKLFKGFPITHIPIVENGQLLGCISESDTQTIEDNSASISEHSHLIDFFFADENITLLELIKLFADNDCNMMPALNKEKQYLGYFELSDVLDAFASSPFLYNNGVEIVASKSKKEYSASEISQIVESNNGKLLGMYISSETSETTQVTVKISSEDINEVIQTFRRYNYNIVSLHQDDFYLQDLKDRSDYLQKYLDM
ncbi:CBS domain-containing protein [Pseudotenacibaculum sp. MALMAid0570]|uniref:CBS domain-containing protein n=1 Tax=Pseudotenacibaculum sp. MALMAid0570 TaxID=3143938 RepID=UPI0032DE9316